MARKVVTGVDLHVEEGGGGTPTLLLLHGLGANGDVWAGLKPILSEQWRGRWVTRICEATGAPAIAHPIAMLATLLIWRRCSGQDEEVVVVGHSMGGVVALALATGWYGFRVSHACVFGIKITWCADEVTKLRQMTQIPVRWFESQDDAVIDTSRFPDYSA